MAIYDALLRPCPACGGEAKLRHCGAYFVECRKCFLQTYTFGSHWEAVKTWNTQKIQRGDQKHVWQ